MNKLENTIIIFDDLKYIEILIGIKNQLNLENFNKMNINRIFIEESFYSKVFSNETDKLAID